jgi:hypothetical protein
MPDASHPLHVPESLGTVFRFFCRHIVCLGGWVQEIDGTGKHQGAPKPFAFSACVLEIRGDWHLLTAGHILQRLGKRLARKEIVILKSYLLAGFGPEVKAHRAAHLPIEFDYEKTDKAYIDQDGLDFGLLDLGKYLRAHLESNEVKPIAEENWRIPSGMEFEDCAILGFPQEFVDIGDISPTMLRVTQLHDLPEDIEPTAWPRFIGKLGDRFPLNSLVGMCGGPIYGFSQRRHPDRYWIPAIQSGWRRDLKITFGCPVPLLAALAEKYLYEDEDEADGGEPQTNEMPDQGSCAD